MQDKGYRATPGSGVPTGPGAPARAAPLLSRTLSPGAAASEAEGLEPVLHEGSPCNERPSDHSGERPSLAIAGESPQAEIDHSQKAKKKILKKKVDFMILEPCCVLG